MTAQCEACGKETDISIVGIKEGEFCLCDECFVALDGWDPASCAK